VLACLLDLILYYWDCFTNFLAPILLTAYGSRFDFGLFHVLMLFSLGFLFYSAFYRQPRGFGFIQFVDPADAADAKYHMDGQVLLGREITVVFAEENRKKPTEMRVRERR
jgi:hypothetical protein